MMSQTYSCGDRDALVAYLYDECDAQERDAVAAHLARCQDCSEELAGLSGTRQLLAAWTPPEASLGFRLPESAMGAGSSPPKASGSRAVWWRQPLPAWAQMAAAIAVFAAGLAVGASRAPERDVASELETRRQLAAAEAAVEALESRVRGIERVAAGLSAPVSVQAASVRPADVVPDVMPRVNAQFATWERRIRGDLATREDLARGLVQLKREEELSRQLIRDEFRTELNEVSRVFLSFRNGE